MKPVEIEERAPLLERLTELRERPVRTTHSSLPEALAGVSRPTVAEGARGLPAAFMGVEKGRTGMLFAPPRAGG